MTLTIKREVLKENSKYILIHYKECEKFSPIINNTYDIFYKWKDKLLPYASYKTKKSALNLWECCTD